MFQNLIAIKKKHLFGWIVFLKKKILNRKSRNFPHPLAAHRESIIHSGIKSDSPGVTSFEQAKLCIFSLTRRSYLISIPQSVHGYDPLGT